MRRVSPETKEKLNLPAWGRLMGRAINSPSDATHFRMLRLLIRRHGTPALGWATKTFHPTELDFESHMQKYFRGLFRTMHSPESKRQALHVSLEKLNLALNDCDALIAFLGKNTKMAAQLITPNRNADSVFHYFANRLDA